MKHLRLHNRLTRPFAATLIALVAFAVSTSPIRQTAYAAAPVNAISYQGRLLDSSGNPVSDASAEFVFRFFDAASGGTCLWESDDASGCDATDETQTVAITDGLFSENIGSSVDPDGLSEAYPFDLSGVFEDNSDVYLEVDINGETLSPRKQIVAAPFALNSQSLDGLDSTDFLSNAGDTATGVYDFTGATIFGGSALSFDGATAGNGFESTFAFDDPTADRTITFQDADGTVALLSDIGAGSALWETDATSTFEDDANVFIGSSVLGAVEAAFVPDGDDLYVAGDIAAQYNIYADEFVAGDASTTFADGSITTAGATDLELSIAGGDLTFAQNTTIGDGGDLIAINSNGNVFIDDSNLTGTGSLAIGVAPNSGLALDAAGGAGVITVGSSADATEIDIAAGAGSDLITIGASDVAVDTIRIGSDTDIFGIDSAEFDVSDATGSITIDDVGDVGSVTVEGTALDIGELSFVAGGTISSGGVANLALSPGGGTVYIDGSEIRGTGSLGVHATSGGALDLNTDGGDIIIGDDPGDKFIRIGGNGKREIEIGTTTDDGYTRIMSGSAGTTLDAVGPVIVTSSTDSISIGSDVGDEDIAIGDAGEHAISIGSITDAGSVSVESGTGDVSLYSTDDINIQAIDDIIMTLNGDTQFSKVVGNSSVGTGVDYLDANSNRAGGFFAKYTILDMLDGAGAGDNFVADAIQLTADDADGDAFGLVIAADETTNAAAGSYRALIRLRNNENTVGAVQDGIEIQAVDGADGGITDALDASDAKITNAINTGSNYFLTSNMRSSEAGGTLLYEDLSSNTLLTLTDAGTTGNLSVTGSLSLGGNLDMANNLILNVGNAGTDFTAGGGLTLAGDIAVNGGDITSSGTLTIDSSGTVQLGTNDSLSTTGSITSALVDSETVGISWAPTAFDTTGDAMTITTSAAHDDTPTNTNYGLHVIQADSGFSPEYGADALAYLENTASDGPSAGLLIGGPAIGYGIDLSPMTAGIDLRLSNTESIDNLTDDMIVLSGANGTDNTDIRFDLDGTMPVIDSPTDSTISISDNLFVGGTSVSGVKSTFVPDGDDIFATGDIAAQDNIYADMFVAGDASTTFGNGVVMTSTDQTSLASNMDVTGGTSTYTYSVQIDGMTGLSVAATGTGGGFVGARTIQLGVSGDADLVTVGDANADVSITDGQWSVAGTGAASFASLGMSGNLDMQNTGLVLNIGNAGTDFVAGGGLTLASTLTANGAATLGNGDGDAISVSSTGWSVSSSGSMSGIGSIDADGNIITSANLSVNGTDISSTNTGGFNLLNTNVTTINLGGETTTFNLANGTAGRTINIGNGTNGNGISIGNGANTQAQSISIGSGPSAANSSVDILSGNATAGTQTLNLGTGTSAKTINLGTGAGANVIGVGSTTGTMSLKGNATSSIDFGNFDVATNGGVTVAAGQGYDVNAAGILGIGNSNATTLNVGNGAATTLNFGATGSLARNFFMATGTGNDTFTVDNDSTGNDTLNLSIGGGTNLINVGSGGGADTINIGTGAGSDVIGIGNAAGTLTLNSGAGVIDFNEFDVSGTTGSVTIDDVGADAGKLTVEGTGLDINSLDFVGVGEVASGAGQILTLNSASGVVQAGVGDQFVVRPQDSPNPVDFFDSPSIDVRGTYYNGATTANFDTNIYTDMKSNGASPTADLVFNLNGATNEMTLSEVGDLKAIGGVTFGDGGATHDLFSFVTSGTTENMFSLTGNQVTSGNVMKISESAGVNRTDGSGLFVLRSAGAGANSSTQGLLNVSMLDDSGGSNSAGYAAKFTSLGTSPSVYIVPQANTGGNVTTSAGGALHIENSSNQNMGLTVFTSQASPSSPLAVLTTSAGATTFNKPLLKLGTAGTGNALSIVGQGTTATGSSIFVGQSGSTGGTVSSTVGGAIHVENSSNADYGLTVYSGAGTSTTTSGLAYLKTDNASFDSDILKISSTNDGISGTAAGTGAHIFIGGNPSQPAGGGYGTQALVLDTSWSGAAPLGTLTEAMLLIRKGVTNMNPTTAGDTVFRVDADGDVFADGHFVGAAFDIGSASDVAEKYPSSESLGPGEIVTVDPAGTGIIRSTSPYQDSVLGVISTEPGVALAADTDGYLLALVGRVPTKVSDENGPISVGDPIVSSSISGYGMKATEPGMIVGFALEDYSGTGPGSISVFVSPQFYVGSVLATDGSATVVSDTLALGSTGTADATTTAFDSNAFELRGSAWDGAAAQNVQMSMATDVTNASDYRLSIKNSGGSEVAYVSQAGDMALSGRLYPSDRGSLQTSKYIYYDGSSGSGGDFMRTNASGWATGSYDFAEMFPSVDALEAGDVVMFGTTNESVLKSNGSSSAIAGIVSTRPGFLAGENRAGDYPIALAGRVPTKVSLENGSIAIGDPLTASATKGYAMKAVESGPIVGYALEAYSGAAGTDDRIVAFVNAGYWIGGATSPTPGATNSASTIIVSQNADNLTALNMEGNVYMAGNDILGVRRIAGLSDRWSLEEDGTVRTAGAFKTVIESYQGEQIETSAVTSPDAQITLVGTATLENGEAVIRFEDASPAFNDVTSTVAPIRVVVTPNGPVSLYVYEKNNDGFGVRQMNGADSGITFDWMVSAFRKDYEPAEAVVTEEPVAVDEPVVEEDDQVVATDAVEEVSAVVDPVVAIPEPVVDESVPVADSTESNSVEPEPAP